MASISSDSFSHPRVREETARHRLTEVVSKHGRLYTLFTYPDGRHFAGKVIENDLGEITVQSILPKKMAFAIYLALRKAGYA